MNFIDAKTLAIYDGQSKSFIPIEVASYRHLLCVNKILFRKNEIMDIYQYDGNTINEIKNITKGFIVPLKGDMAVLLAEELESRFNLSEKTKYDEGVLRYEKRIIKLIKRLKSKDVIELPFMYERKLLNEGVMKYDDEAQLGKVIDFN